MTNYINIFASGANKFSYYPGTFKAMTGQSRRWGESQSQWEQFG